MLFGFGLLLAVVPIPVVSFSVQSVGAVADVPSTVAMSATDHAAAQAAVDEPIGADRVVASDTATGTFTAIGFTFDDQPTGPVLVRIKEPSGGFGDWRELHAEDSDGPDVGTGEASRSGTEPLWVEEATGYEVSLSTTDAAGARVVTVHDELHRSTTDATPLAGAATAPSFGVHLRGAWGARATNGSPSYASTVKLAVVHHSDSSNTYSPAEVPAVMRSIQAFHMDGRGWSDIAYNFVVDKYGGIWEGRGGGIDRAVIGAHSMGFNTTSVGVMVIGDYTAATPSAASIESVSQVIGWKLALHGVDPNGRVDFTSGGSTKYAAGVVVNLPRVVGHQDVGLTSCPGSIQASLGTVRARSGDWYRWTRATMVPVGNLEAVATGYNVVQMLGWAKDPNITGPALVRATVAGITVTGRANGYRPDVAVSNPSFGSNTGFELFATNVPPGFQEACITAVNESTSAGDALLGCPMVKVLDGAGTSPTGDITGIAGGVGIVGVSGTTTDPDSSGPRWVSVEIDGLVRSTVASTSSGAFDTQIVGVPGGRRRVCVIARNAGAGVDTRVDCKFVDVVGASPDGWLEQLVLRNGNVLRTQGWTLDRESVAPLVVLVTVDGVSRPVSSDWVRPDVVAGYPVGYENKRGFLWEMVLPKGGHRVCVTAVNVWHGADSTLGCRDLVVK